MRLLGRISATATLLALSGALLAVPASAEAAPVAVDDAVALPDASPAVLDVLSNDQWTDPAQLVVPSAGRPTAPEHGTVAATTTTTATGATRPAVLYTPDAAWFGSDAFTYTLTDATGQDATARVSVTVPTAPPSIGPDSATTPPGAAISIPVLGNDVEPYGAALTVTSASDPRRGSTSIDAGAASVTYTPDAGWTGVDTFTYSVASASGTSGTATVTVTTLESTPGHGVTLSAPASVVVQRTATFAGAVAPPDGGPVRVVVQRLRASGWLTVVTTSATTGGGWSVAYRPDVPGLITWRALASWPDGSTATTLARTRVVASLDSTVSGRLTRKAVPYSYRNGCPVGPVSLRRLSANFWSYDGTVKRGSIILRASAVAPVRSVLARAFEARFRFKKLVPVDAYYLGGTRTPTGSDLAAMNDGNTSAFNCRPVTGNRYRLSQHAYGNAVDVNTFENPYVTSSRVYPAAAAMPYYRYRTLNLADHGVLSSWSAVTKAFRVQGWVWGGRWSPPDYQHFSSNGG